LFHENTIRVRHKEPLSMPCVYLHKYCGHKRPGDHSSISMSCLLVRQNSSITLKSSGTSHACRPLVPFQTLYLVLFGHKCWHNHASPNGFMCTSHMSGVRPHVTLWFKSFQTISPETLRLRPFPKLSPLPAGQAQLQHQPMLRRHSGRAHSW
jgi:hypothetical protein